MKLAFAAVCLLVPGYAADWDPAKAAAYLDGRQKEWSGWAAAKETGGTCFSCHTGLTYMMARPVLRQMLSERGPTRYETELLNGLISRVDKREGKELKPGYAAEPLASQSMGVEAVLSAWAMASQDPGSAGTQQAFERMWVLQIREGEAAGAWHWFSLNLDPWEMPDAQFFGATIAALAVGEMPAEYRGRPQVAPRVAALVAYLRANASKQPQHNSLMLLWASTKIPAVMTAGMRKAVTTAAWSGQGADGGWPMEALGPWKKREEAPAAEGSSAYATALTVFVLERLGVTAAQPEMRMAMAWLREHQDPATGAWPAVSMNKVYPAGSMQVRFMSDAATAYAVMALGER